MKIKRVERYTIPMEHPMVEGEGTTAYELYRALGKLPEGAIITVDHVTGGLFATYTYDDLEVEL